MSGKMSEQVVALISALSAAAGAIALKIIEHLLGEDVREFDQAAALREELRRDIDRLRDEKNELQSRIAALESKLEGYYELVRENIELKAEVKELRERLEQLENGLKGGQHA